MSRVCLPALWVALLLATVIAPAVAHEGHDHDAPPAPRSTTSAPRAETASDSIELVVIARGGELELYIDDFRTNAPIDDAAVEVETPTGPEVAKPESGRPYRLAAPWALKPGRHDLVATVIRQQASEIDQQIAIVERRLTRLRSLRDVVPRTQSEDTETELRGLRERRASLDQARREPEPLVAPMDGVVATSTAATGRIADPGTVVSQIIDPRHLWVEALQFEALGQAQQASARLPDGRIAPLAFRGSGLAGPGQAIPLHFAITGDLSGLRVGQLVTVLADTEATQEGLALPRSAVLRGSSGVSIVYEHSAAEQFRPHEVRIAPLNGDRMLAACRT